jgi:aryl-alcohol dehydrogenase-like predicted oxidoreductase
MQELVSYGNNNKIKPYGGNTMKLTRRQVIAAGASAGAYMAIGASSALAKEQRTVLSKIIPSSGEALPVIGIGTNRWVAAGPASEIQGLRDTLQIFNAMGGRVIDTAPVYRTSEKALGQIIRELGLDTAFFLATKVDKTEKAAGIKRMEDSLEKLHRKRMDLMQVHNMRGAEAQLETLFEWREPARISMPRWKR